MRAVAKIVAGNVLVLAALVLLVEAAAATVQWLWPAYDVLFLQPDRELGWKEVPNFHWIWAGHYWYGADFRVDVDTNAVGFRDVAHETEKPHGVARVALLGDSFIEAAQVPFEGTAGQLLQRRLNARAGALRWEVLNFGVSNYGVGQYLLTWQHYARAYQPNDVAVFVAKLHMQRTVSPYEIGAFRSTEAKRLWVRPTFALDQGVLVLHPARDFDEFTRVQADEIQYEFGGARTRQSRHWLTVEAAGRVRDWTAQALAAPNSGQDSLADLLAVNLALITEIGRSVRAAGGRFIVVDVSQYFHDEPRVAEELGQVCADNGFVHVPLSDDLAAANARGIATRWAHDYHFNAAGNEILAAALDRVIDTPAAP
jgi:hypothetical protein